MTAGVDTLQISKDLQAASFTPTQAEALAKLIRERQAADLTMLATNSDITLLRMELAQLEQRLTIKLGGMLAVAVGVTTALVKLL